MPTNAAGFKKAMGWNIAFFVAACMVIATSVLTMLELLVEFAPFQFISQVYLALFGLLMMILDWPFQQDRIRPYKMHIYKFLLFMTRFVGRGVWYIFLGTMVFASLWDLDVSPFLGIVLGGYIIILGFASAGYGIKLSMKLDKVRMIIKRDQRYSDPTHVCPKSGISPEQLVTQIVAVAGQEFSFTPEELNYVCCGLNHHPEHPEVISFNDYCYWTGEGRMAIL